MDTEYLRIFDKNRNPIGVATREEVHKVGHWHEVFHCWFVSKEEGKDYIYLQLRSETKKDYPNLLDITAAGHLLADETVENGVREIQEEIGIEVSLDQLEPLGIINYSIIKNDFIDKEFAHIFLYTYNQTFDDFTLQKEEVKGILRAEFDEFYKLWYGEVDMLRVEGIEIDQYGNKVRLERIIDKDEFVPGDVSFYQKVVRLIGDKLNNQVVNQSG